MLTEVWNICRKLHFHFKAQVFAWSLFMRQITTRRATACKLLVTGLLLAGAARPAAAQTAYGLLYGYRPTPSTFATAIATFDVTKPGTPLSIAPITGVNNPYSVIAIDVRPATGELFALGYTGTQAQLYKLNSATGTATTVGAALTLPLGGSYNGNHSIGFSFDPVTDRIRVTSVNRTNYRFNPTTGALDATDGTLTYASTDPNASQTPGVGSSAHTNSYLGATSATLYDLDLAHARLVTQTPANSGTLSTVATLTSSLLPIPFSTSYPVINIDLAIYTDPATHTNTGYLSRNASGTNITSDLYSLDLATGIATPVGQFNWQVGSYITDIALASPTPMPAPLTGQLAYALAGASLITFDTALPGAIRTSTGITGVAAGQTLVGLDMRPATSALYALGYDAAAAPGVANAQLYTLNATTGAATAVGAAGRLELGTGNVGFDFNPATDQIRVVATNQANYRLHPLNGAIIGLDGTLTYNPATSLPTIGAVAYSNSFSGATSTTLYNYDLALNQLNTQATANPPADGLLTSMGPSGIAVNPATPLLDFDIYSSGAGVNTAYLVASTSAPASTSLYTLNLTTGATTLVGLIGNGFAARNIAVAVATNVVTATRPADLATDLRLYPNPATGSLSLNFSLSHTAHTELVVTDLLGRTVDIFDAGVLPAGAQTVRWQRGTQAAGVYLVNLRLNGQPAGTRRAVLTP